MKSTFLDIYIESNIGGRGENQDYALKLVTKLGQLILVCDGMGGAKGGALASELASNIIRKEFEGLTGTEQPLEAMQKAIQKANKVIFEKSRSNAEVRGMGTTVALLLISDDHTQAYTAHVGDSRVYQIRKGKRLFQTRDHSVVQDMVQRGELKEKDARTHPASNQITRALGIREVAEVEQNHLSFKPYDVFLITSDGIHGEIDESNLLKIVVKGPTSTNIAQNLMQTSFQNGKQSKNGKHDNLTVAAIVLFYSSRKRIRDPKIIALLITIALFAGLLFYLLCNDERCKTNDPVNHVPYTPSATISAIEAHCNEVKTSTKISAEVNRYKNTLANNFAGYGTLDTTTCKFTPIPEFNESDDEALKKILKKLKENWNKIR